MSSPTMQEVRNQFSSRDWTITTPSHPNIKFVRFTPIRFEEMIPLCINPENNEFQDTKDKIWDELEIKEQLAGLATRYEKGGMEAFIDVDGKVVGYGGVWVNEATNKGDIGLVLNKEGRGKGLGKLTVRILAQMCFQMGFVPTLGTMKANEPMRGVMRSLGVEEVEDIIVSPTRGVVAELSYSMRKDDWEEIEMNVEFENI